MSIAGTSLNGIAGAVGRGLRMLSKRHQGDELLDPYEPAPLNREDMTPMFELEETDPLFQAEKLRASERREHETLNMIRAALYPSNGPRADSNT